MVQPTRETPSKLLAKIKPHTTHRPVSRMKIDPAIELLPITFNQTGSLSDTCKEKVGSSQHKAFSSTEKVVVGSKACLTVAVVSTSWLRADSIQEGNDKGELPVPAIGPQW